MENQHPNSKRNKLPWFFAFLLALVLICYFAWVVYTRFFWDASLGQYGDSFGVINTLFSGLALSIVAISIWQTQRQLGVQQEDLRLNREELKGQREQMEQQNRHLEKQGIRNQFFQMLDSWQTTMHQTRMEHRHPSKVESVESQGRSAFAAIFSSLDHTHPSPTLVEQSLEEFAGSVLREAREAYEPVYQKHGDALGHYFRLMCHAIRFIHAEDTLNEGEKKDFIRILRAHLSQSEALLLLYNGISVHGERLYPLIEKYDLLQNLDASLLPRPEVMLAYPKRFLAEKVKWVQGGNELRKSIAKTYLPFYAHDVPKDCADVAIATSTVVPVKKADGA